MLLFVQLCLENVRYSEERVVHVHSPAEHVRVGKHPRITLLTTMTYFEGVSQRTDSSEFEDTDFEPVGMFTRLCLDSEIEVHYV